MDFKPEYFDDAGGAARRFFIERFTVIYGEVRRDLYTFFVCVQLLYVE